MTHIRLALSQNPNEINTEYNVDEKYHLALKTAFASEYAFTIKAQNFHWNVEGPLFGQLHELFGSIYEETYGSIDTFAEQLRALQIYTPASLERFSMLSKVDDENEILPFEQMLRELLSDSDKMADIFKITFTMAENSGDHGLSNFLADRQDAHKKHSWMLRASLK
jgi:starvation-inducible DNA-binding protein